MGQFIHDQDSLNSSKSVAQLSTLEEKLRNSFASPTFLPPQDFNGGLALAEFRLLPLADLTETDVKVLDKARRSALYIYDFTVQEFVDALQRGDYDVWKLQGIDDCLCIILTTYEVYPHSRHLMVHYLAGLNCRPYIVDIKRAIKEVMVNGNCEKVVYLAPKEHYAKIIGGKKLATLYEMTED